MKKHYLFAIVFLAFHFLSAQERLVFGTVSDSLGVLPGANVLVKGTHRGTQTDMDGKYSIKATAKDTLVFSFVAMKTKKVRAEQAEINVTLQNGVQLKEVVGPAYYPKRKGIHEGQVLSVKDIQEGNQPAHTAIGQPRIQFEKLSYDFGEINQHDTALKEIPFTNTGDKPLIIEQVQTTDDSGVADRPVDPILPGKSGVIRYKRETSRLGMFIKTITVKTNDPLQQVIVLHIKGEIIPLK